MTGRIPYQAKVRVTTGGGGCPSNGVCIFNAPAIPAGKRLVVQHVVVSVGLSTVPTPSPPGAIETFIQNGNSDTPGPILSSFLVPFIGLNADVDQAVQFYVDAGETYFVTVIVRGGNGTLFATSFNVTGYLLDCSANQCAKIAP